ncbi:MAG: hypothetical protein KBG67_04440 [Candidatus Atribacteria bacterium]|nr:hypothetical protein [Candidatus Atribacteria bacterium]
MTMKNKVEFYEQGLEEYPKSGILLSNFVMLLWIALGTIACWFLYPLMAWIYLAFAIIMVFVVLRNLICTNCYYYDKWCCTGWGKLSALFFKKGDTQKFNSSYGLKLAPLTYGLLTLVPLISSCHFIHSRVYDTEDSCIDTSVVDFILQLYSQQEKDLCEL